MWMATFFILFCSSLCFVSCVIHRQTSKNSNAFFSCRWEWNGQTKSGEKKNGFSEHLGEYAIWRLEWYKVVVHDSPHTLQNEWMESFISSFSLSLPLLPPYLTPSHFSNSRRKWVVRYSFFFFFSFFFFPRTIRTDAVLTVEAEPKCCAYLVYIHINRIISCSQKANANVGCRKKMNFSGRKLTVGVTSSNREMKSTCEKKRTRIWNEYIEIVMAWEMV